MEMPAGLWVYVEPADDTALLDDEDEDGSRDELEISWVNNRLVVTVREDVRPEALALLDPVVSKMVRAQLPTPP